MSILILLDGLKVEGEGSHKQQITYLRKNCLTEGQASTIDELRQIRNRISYDGFFVNSDYLMRKEAKLLETTIKDRL